jgi:molybdopterin converting factor small subunit
LAGTGVVEIEVGNRPTVADVRRALIEKVPALGGWVSHLRIAINEEYAADDESLPAGAAVACIPPVSGG